MQNYVIQNPLKSSAWTQSYLAVDETNGRQIVLKFITHPTAQDPIWYSSFLQRMTAVHKVARNNPNAIAPVYAWGRLARPLPAGEETIAANMPYVSIDYIQGETLAAMLEIYQKLSLPLAADILEQIAVVLDQIHNAGLAHGNLKPANILFGPDDKLFLTDFHLTPSGGYLMNVGEQLSREDAAYVSPEQTQAEQAVTPRSDIYNLGLIFFEMVTGQRPFQGQSTSHLLRQHAFNAPPPARRFNNELPAEIEPILQKALAKNDLARYATAQEMATAVRQLIPDKPDEQQAEAAEFDFPMPVVVPVTSMAPDPLTTITLAAPDKPPEPPPTAVKLKPEPRKSNRPAALTLFVIVGLLFAISGCAAAVFVLLAATPTAPNNGAQATIAANPEGGDLAGLLSGSLTEELAAIEPTGPRALVELARFGEGAVREVKALPANGTIAVTGLTGVTLYDDRSLTPLNEITSHPSQSVAWLADGRLLAAANSQNGRAVIDIFDGEGQPRGQLPTNSLGDINQLAASGDGRQLAVLLAADQLQIWSIDDSQMRGQWSFEPDRAQYIAWSPAADQLAVALNNRTALIINAQTEAVEIILEGSEFNITAVAWSPDGAYLAGTTSSGRMIVWSVDDGRVLAEQRAVSAVAWTTDGRLIGGNFDGQLFLWEMADLLNGDLESDLIWNLHESAILSLQWLPDPPRLLSWSAQGWLRLHDGDSGGLLAERANFLSSSYHAVSDLAWSPDGRYLAASSWDSTIRLWDTETAVVTQTLLGHRSYIGPIDWSPDGQWLASGSIDSGAALRLWSTATGEGQILAASDDSPARSVAFSPDGRYLAFGLESGVLIAQPIPPGDFDPTLRGQASGKRLSGLAWTADGERLIAGGGDGRITIWQMPDGALLHSWQGEEPLFDMVIALSPTEPLMALAVSMAGIELRSTETGERIGQMESVSSVSANQLAFSSDGRWLALVGGRSPVVIFEVESGQVAFEGIGHNAAVRSVVWSPTIPNRLATGGDDGVIRLWLLPEGEPGR